MDDKPPKKPRLIKQTLQAIWSHRQEGDILMDVEDTEWSQLIKLT